MTETEKRAEQRQRQRDRGVNIDHRGSETETQIHSVKGGDRDQCGLDTIGQRRGSKVGIARLEDTDS